MSWLIEAQDLTLDQQRAVQMDSAGHKVIVGAPGSGKTQILLHRARHLLDEPGTDQERLHVFVFTRVLRSYIQAALQDLGIPRSCVSTLDAWCLDYHRTHIGGKVPREAGANQPDFDTIRRLVADALRRLPADRKPLDVALVDEGQDLDGHAIELLTAAARHVTVCMDRKQRIYENGSDEMAVVARLGVRKRNITLLDALRCSPYVTKLASVFVSDPVEAGQWQQQARVGHIERETPLLYVSTSFEDEKKRLAEVLQTRLENNDRVVVLFPSNRQVFGFAQGLRKMGFELETNKELDFTSDLPKLITYHSAKGLTFDSVLMPRLVPSSFRSNDAADIQRLLFVAVTRASKWVYMSTDASFFRPLRDVLPLVREGAVRVEGQIAVEPLF